MEHCNSCEKLENSFHEAETYKEQQRNMFLLSLLLTIPIALWTFTNFKFLTPPYKEYVSFVLATVVVFFCGKQFFENSWKSLKEFDANMDTLVSLGLISSYAYSVYSLLFLENMPIFFETSAMLTTFILLGRYLEAISKGKASSAIQKLMELRPPTTTIIKGKTEMKTSVEDVKVGDIIVIKPGDKIPVDGVIIEGVSHVDESLVTGESNPVKKEKGDVVVAGTINKRGSFTFKAEKIGKDTFLQQMVKLIDEARAGKIPMQKLADKVSKIFVPVVLVISIGTFYAWIHFGYSHLFALTAAVSVLVIACPCALGLATPTAVMVGSSLGAKNGILIRNGESLEIIGKMNTLVLDKTGTLTIGNPSLTNLAVANNFDPKITLRYAAIAEKRSEHPLAEAIIAKAKSMKLDFPDPKEFRSYEGKGVLAKTSGKTIVVGKKSFLEDKKINVEKLNSKIKEFEEAGKTVVLVGVNGQIAGAMAIADDLKENSKKAVKQLQDSGIEVVIVTGDNEVVAKSIADKLEVEEFIANATPEYKVNKIVEMKKEGKIVGMAGDGVNDAPALKTADIGIALGTGTDISIEAGDLVLMKSDVLDIPKAINLSRKTLSKIKQNLYWAFGYNILAIPIAAGVFYSWIGLQLRPEIAGLAMALSSVSVVLNSLTLRN